LRELDGKRRISDLSLVPALGWSFAKGKTFSSKTTSLEIYTRPVDISRHLNPL
jgi:hypothetical protein